MDSTSSDESREVLLRGDPSNTIAGLLRYAFGGFHSSKPGRVVWETGNAQNESEILVNEQAIDGDMMNRWIVQWLSPQRG